MKLSSLLKQSAKTIIAEDKSIGSLITNLVERLVNKLRNVNIGLDNARIPTRIRTTLLEMEDLKYVLKNADIDSIQENYRRLLESGDVNYEIMTDLIMEGFTSRRVTEKEYNKIINKNQEFQLAGLLMRVIRTHPDGSFPITDVIEISDLDQQYLKNELPKFIKSNPDDFRDILSSITKKHFDLNQSQFIINRFYGSDLTDTPVLAFDFEKLEVEINMPEYLYVIFNVDDIESAVDRFVANLEDEKKEKEQTEIVKPDYELTQDQLLLINYMDKRNVDSIPSIELKNTELYRYPFVKQLVDNNKVITKELILREKTSSESESISNIYKNIKDNCEEIIKRFTMSVQIIFNDPNMVYVLGIHEEDLMPTFGMKNIPEKVSDYYRTTIHPRIDKDHLTLGWVRFTKSKEDSTIVWIDEIQTDLYKMNEFDAKKYFGNMETLLSFITLRFLNIMRKKGIRKFYIPSIEMKKELYQSNPPKTSYVDVPKRLRFRKDIIKNVDIWKYFSPNKPITNNNVWVLGKRKDNNYAS